MCDLVWGIFFFLVTFFWDQPVNAFILDREVAAGGREMNVVVVTAVAAVSLNGAVVSHVC